MNENIIKLVPWEKFNIFPLIKENIKQKENHFSFFNDSNSTFIAFSTHKRPRLKGDKDIILVQTWFDFHDLRKGEMFLAIIVIDRFRTLPKTLFLGSVFYRFETIEELLGSSKGPILTTCIPEDASDDYKNYILNLYTTSFLSW